MKKQINILLRYSKSLVFVNSRKEKVVAFEDQAVAQGKVVAFEDYTKSIFDHE